MYEAVLTHELSEPVLGPRQADCRRPSAGFTVVELLVVIGIVGILFSLLLPAVQAARESARASTCRDHLKQIGLAAHLHLDVHGHFPSGGWGHLWTGDPDRGHGRGQPGGWVYNLLPYVEYMELHELGAGLTGQDKMDAAARRMSLPLPLFSCPTRRSPIQYPVSSFRYATLMKNAATATPCRKRRLRDQRRTHGAKLFLGWWPNVCRRCCGLSRFH